MNFGSVALKGLIVIVTLFLLSLAGAVTFPLAAAVAAGAVGGLTSILLILLAIFVLSLVGNLLARGIRSVKKPFEALLLAFVGSFFMGAALALFAILNTPYAPRVNLAWVGTAWYSPALAFLFIGTPLMIIFLVGE